LIFQIDKQELRQKLDALRELLREKERREQAAHDCAYANTIAERTRSGFWCVSMKTPAIIIHEITIDPTLPEPEDVQRERQLAELRDPKYWVERVIVDPPVRQDDWTARQPLPAVPKAFVEDNARRAERSPQGRHR
jgi:hypothetical protein